MPTGDSARQFPATIPILHHRTSTTWNEKLNLESRHQQPIKG